MTKPAPDEPPPPIPKMPWSDWWSLVKQSGVAWLDDYAPSMGAALSYYMVFSLAPLLLIVVSIAGLVFGEDAARGEIFGQLRSFMGAEAASAVEGLLKSLNKPDQGIVSAAIGVGVLLIGATTVFGELQDALDRIWRAPARDKSGGLWGLLRTRLLSFGMILGIAFLLMVSLVLGAVISALGAFWSDFFGGWEVLAQIVNLVIGFGLTTVVFAMIYKLMPRVTVRWHDVWLGAFVTAVLFTVGKFLIGLYIGKSGVASGFGAAGSLIVVFVWVYYSAQIFLMGAEFTWIYARMFGSMRSLELAGAPHEVKLEAAMDTAPAPISATPSAEASRDVPTRHAPARVRPLPKAPAPPRPTTATDVGIGLGFALFARYVLPRLLRRKR